MSNGVNRKIINKGDYIELELTGGDFTKIDLDTYELIKEYSWYKSLRNSVESRIKYKLIKLHRFIMNAKKGEYVDHINGDILDNRRCNLRICSIQENSCNKNASKNSKTGIKGVRFDNKTQSFCVQIKSKQKRIWGGRFKKLKDAIDKVNILTKYYHGDFNKQQYENN